jgi:NADH dehydrogenase (ubiquinone) 1 beta subcomplex subunit 11
MSVHRILQRAGRVSSLAMNLSRVNGASSIVPLQKQPIAFISTSKKNRDTTITADPTTSSTVPKTVEDFANPNKTNYQSYGFIDDDKDWDINIRNYIMFWTVTVGMVGFGFVITYFPDVRMKDWTQREAYVELARREANGLPIIDPNLVPADQVDLPTDEELGDFDIIV